MQINLNKIRIKPQKTKSSKCANNWIRTMNLFSFQILLELIMKIRSRTKINAKTSKQNQITLSFKLKSIQLSTTKKHLLRGMNGREDTINRKIAYRCKVKNTLNLRINQNILNTKSANLLNLLRRKLSNQILLDLSIILHL